MFNFVMNCIEFVLESVLKAYKALPYVAAIKIIFFMPWVGG